MIGNVKRVIARMINAKSSSAEEFAYRKLPTAEIDCARIQHIKHPNLADETILFALRSKDLFGCVRYQKLKVLLS